MATTKKPTADAGAATKAAAGRYPWGNTKPASRLKSLGEQIKAIEARKTALELKQAAAMKIVTTELTEAQAKLDVVKKWMDDQRLERAKGAITAMVMRALPKDVDFEAIAKDPDLVAGLQRLISERGRKA